MSINPQINEIFKESIDKLNSMILFLDTQLGTVSLSKEEIDSINGVPHKYQPLENIDSSQSEKKEDSKKKEKKEKQKPSENEQKDSNKENDKNEKKENNKKEKKEHKKEKKEKKEKNENNENNENKENKENKEKIKGQKKGMDAFEMFKLTDLRVGKVVSAKIMEGFNDVYELKIDIGEPEPRNIGTGLRNYVPIEKIQDSKVILFSNLKPKRFGKNFESHGMIMCAGKKDGENKEAFELIRPNENAKVGEKVYIEGTELDNSVVPQITGGYFKKCITHFKTDENCICMYNGKKMITESGEIKVETLANCEIS